MRCLDSLYFPQSGFYFIGFVGLAIGLDNQDVGAFESLNPEPCLSFGVLTLRMQGFVWPNPSTEASMRRLAGSIRRLGNPGTYSTIYLGSSNYEGQENPLRRSPMSFHVIPEIQKSLHNP